ncbi:MAG: hypothetical protein ACP5U2_07520 [Bryobacteraceae bacterium]
MTTRICALEMLLVSLALADTLTLRNGKTVQGTYLGGTARQIRMAVGDRVETYDVSEVARLEFEGSAAAQTPAPARPPVVQLTETARPPAAPSSAAEAPAGVLRSARPATAASAAGQLIEIPAGTALVVRMIDSVDSEKARPGQTFRASLDEPVVINGQTIIPRGANVLTRLVEIKDPSKLTGGGQLTLDLDSITVGGRTIPVVAGEVTQAGRSRTGESAKVIGGTAALGAIIGAIAGGGRGAAIGAASGAGAGTAIQVLTSGPRVQIPSETRLTFTLQQPLRL